jgi:rhodanese-related sulfurtransferase
MVGFNEISPQQLMRLIGTTDAPAIVDVRLGEDITLNPSCVPLAIFCAASKVLDLQAELLARPVVVVCHRGKKLSHGAAALLRSVGVKAEVLEGGSEAWSALKLPAIPLNALPNNRHSLWVTRHRPKIDRLACPWLIRRFVDPNAQFLYVPAAEVDEVATRFNATAFDMPGGGFSHIGERCSFDAMLDAFALHTDPLDHMATVIRGADTNMHALAPECAGLLALSVGLSRKFKDDLAQLEAALPIYDALYHWARDGRDESHDWDQGPSA